MHDKSTKVRGFIEHKSTGCVVEDFAVVINVFRMSHMASRAPRFCHELNLVRFVTKIPLWEGGKIQRVQSALLCECVTANLAVQSASRQAA